MGAGLVERYGRTRQMTPKVPVVVFSPGVPADGGSCARVVTDAIEAIDRQGIPLVLCPPQTRAEIEALQLEVGIAQPFISENGAAVFVPRGYLGGPVPHAMQTAAYDVLEFGRPYADVVGILRRTARHQRTEVVGFSDMSIEEVALDCGLSLMRASLAKLREYGEPFRILDLESGRRMRLFKALHDAGLGCTSGLRFDHVGAPVDPALGVVVLTNLLRAAFGPLVTIGIGWSLADVPLLGRVDIPLVVEHTSANLSWQIAGEVSAARIAGRGAEGWAGAILETVEAVRRRAPLPMTRQWVGRSRPT